MSTISPGLDEQDHNNDPVMRANTTSNILVDGTGPVSMHDNDQATSALSIVNTEPVLEAVPAHAEPSACCPFYVDRATKYSESRQLSFPHLHAASIERDMHLVEIDCNLADDADDAVAAVCAVAAKKNVKTVLSRVADSEMSEPVLKVQQSSQLDAMTLFNQLRAVNLMRPGRALPIEQRVDIQAMMFPRVASNDEPHDPEQIFARTRPKTLDEDLLVARLRQVGSQRERLVKPQSEY
jgi:hypothetical protein